MPKAVARLAAPSAARESRAAGGALGRGAGTEIRAAGAAAIWIEQVGFQYGPQGQVSAGREDPESWERTCRRTGQDGRGGQTARRRPGQYAPTSSIPPRRTNREEGARGSAAPAAGTGTFTWYARVAVLAA